MQEESYYEVLYLAAKFCTNSVRNSEDRQMTTQYHNYAAFFVNTLNASHSQMKEKAVEWHTIPRNTLLFYFMHGSKWMLKYLEKFFDHVLIPRKNRDNFEYSHFVFYEKHGLTILNMVVSMLSVSDPEDLARIHYF